jgi:hypothetical protein
MDSSPKFEMDLDSHCYNTEMDTDSAYGSLNEFKPPVADDWRFQIYPQDLSIDSTTIMFKEHVKERLLIESFEGGILYCSTQLNSCSPKEIFSMEDALLDATLAEDDGEMSDAVFMMSPPPSPAIPENIPVSPKKDNRDGKCFPCSMCSSTFSRNHDLKRHLR